MNAVVYNENNYTVNTDNILNAQQGQEVLHQLRNDQTIETGRGLAQATIALGVTLSAGIAGITAAKVTELVILLLTLPLFIVPTLWAAACSLGALIVTVGVAGMIVKKYGLNHFKQAKAHYDNVKHFNRMLQAVRIRLNVL